MAIPISSDKMPSLSFWRAKEELEMVRPLLEEAAQDTEAAMEQIKDNIPDSVIILIQPYMDNEDFHPYAIHKVSMVCTSICRWVRATHVYHFVARGVATKRKALKEAQEDLEATQRILDEAKEELAECRAKRDELARKCQQCEDRLV